MEMKKSLRKTAGIVIISLIIIVLFGTDSNKKVTKEYVLSDKEILGQEAEWELVKSQLPFFAYLLHEKNQDNMYEQFVLHFFPLYQYLAEQEVLAKASDNRKDLVLGTELEKQILEENAYAKGKKDEAGTNEADTEKNESESNQNPEGGESPEEVKESSQEEFMQTAPDIFLTKSDFEPAMEKSREYNWDSYADMEKFREEFFAVDSTTEISDNRIAPKKLLEKEISLQEGNGGPQILIYHTHSQESFADSIPGDKNTTILGAGEYLAGVLHDTYGYEVLHHSGEYDVETRDYAYSYALPNIEAILNEYPSIEVVIDLHRDAVSEDRRLVSLQNGKQAAQLMFFNGLSHTKKQGDISYLENPYIDDNLAFSFQMQVLCNEYYPGLARRIYLKGYRYNMHLCSKSLLVELGAQTNTCEEIKNSLDILAHLLSMCLADEN